MKIQSDERETRIFTSSKNTMKQNCGNICFVTFVFSLFFSLELNVYRAYLLVSHAWCNDVMFSFVAVIVKFYFLFHLDEALLTYREKCVGIQERDLFGDCQDNFPCIIDLAVLKCIPETWKTCLYDCYFISLTRLRTMQKDGVFS